LFSSELLLTFSFRLDDDDDDDDIRVGVQALTFLTKSSNIDV